MSGSERRKNVKKLRNFQWNSFSNVALVKVRALWRKRLARLRLSFELSGLAAWHPLAGRALEPEENRNMSGSEKGSQVDQTLEIERVLRQLDPPVWIVTSTLGSLSASGASQGTGGLLATWVHHVSIDPRTPRLLVGIAPNHYTCKLIEDSGILVAHLLTCQQQELAYWMASRSGGECEKLAGHSWQRGKLGGPILSHVHSWLECRVFARLDTGDRVFFWADVVDGNCCQPSGAYLTQSGFLGALSAEQRSVLRRDRERDIEVQAPGGADWREHLPPGLLFSPRGNKLS